MRDEIGGLEMWAEGLKEKRREGGWVFEGGGKEMMGDGVGDGGGGDECG